jgi:hypothetical protein
MEVHNAENDRAALVVAHPGHELAVLGWLQHARPSVFVLTDGSGRDGEPRIDSTAEILEAAGAEPAPPLFGAFREMEIYAALLEGRCSLFVELAEELARHFVAGDYRMVAGEAAEGFQPTHDTCRLVVDAATELASRELGRPLPGYDFVLFSRQADCPPGRREEAVWIELDDSELEHKLQVALDYEELAAEFHAAVTGDYSAVLGDFPELAEAAAGSIGQIGREAYRVECLRRVPPGIQPVGSGRKPFYELYGEALRRAGRVDRVIRFEEHVQPVAEALARRLDGHRGRRLTRSAQAV